MYELVNTKIMSTAPERVYIFPEMLTQAEIDTNVNKLHIIANEDSDRTLYCLFDDIENTNRKYQVCFPMTHLNLQKYSTDDITVLQRETAVTAEYRGEFPELSLAVAELVAFAEKQGYTVFTPYRYLFILHKKKAFSKKPQDFSMQIHLPVRKTEEEETSS